MDVDMLTTAYGPIPTPMQICPDWRGKGMTTAQVRYGINGTEWGRPWRYSRETEHDPDRLPIPRREEI